MSRIIADTDDTYPKYVWSGTNAVLFVTIDDGSGGFSGGGNPILNTGDTTYIQTPVTPPAVSDATVTQPLLDYMVLLYNQQFKTAITAENIPTTPTRTFLFMSQTIFFSANLRFYHWFYTAALIFSEG